MFSHLMNPPSFGCVMKQTRQGSYQTGCGANRPLAEDADITSRRPAVPVLCVGIEGLKECLGTTPHCHRRRDG